MLDWDEYAITYQIDYIKTKFDYEQVTIQRGPMTRDGGHLWTVRRPGSQILSRDLEWIYEPFPTARGESFMALTRYATREEAAEMYFKWKGGPVKKKPRVRLQTRKGKK